MAKETSPHTPQSFLGATKHFLMYSVVVTRFQKRNRWEFVPNTVSDHVHDKARIEVWVPKFWYFQLFCLCRRTFQKHCRINSSVRTRLRTILNRFLTLLEHLGSGRYHEKNWKVKQNSSSEPPNPLWSAKERSWVPEFSCFLLSLMYRGTF